MDESGTSSTSPRLVVVGIIVEADRTLPALESAIRDIVAPHVAEPARFVVHATEIMANNKKLPAELQQNPEARMAILDGMASLPVKLGIRICAAMVPRGPFNENHPGVSSHVMHASAIAMVSLSAERFMRERARDEVAWIVAEHNHDVVKAAKATHLLMKEPDAIKRLNLQGGAMLPLQRIKDGITFATKAESPALQLADFCSWCLYRWYDRKSEMSHRFYLPLEDALFIQSMTTVDGISQPQSVGTSFGVSMYSAGPNNTRR